MNDNEVREILNRAGIQVEGQMTVRQLDKFENTITDIGLRLVKDDDYDPASAGMDILDAVNDRMMNESWHRRSGTWYDPIERALELLHESGLDEDSLQDVERRVRQPKWQVPANPSAIDKQRMAMARQAADYLKGTNSELDKAEVTPGVDAAQSGAQAAQGGKRDLTSISNQLSGILGQVRRTGGRMSPQQIEQMDDLIHHLDTFQKGRWATKLKNLFSSIGETRYENTATNLRVLDEMCGACQAEMDAMDGDDEHMQEFRSVMGRFHELEDYLRENGMADVAEQIETHLVQLWDWYDALRSGEKQFDEDIDEIRRLAGMNEDHDRTDVLRTVIPEIRSIGIHYVMDSNAKQRLGEIADQLGELQRKV